MIREIIRFYSNEATVFLTLSVLFVIAVVFIAVYKRREYTEGRYKKDNSLVLYMLLILLAVWMLRLAVIGSETESSDAMTRTSVKGIISSIIFTLQTFSLDADYVQYIDSVRSMSESIFHGPGFLSSLCVFYASLLNVVAPIGGGAILLSIIQEFWPKTKFIVYKFAWWKKKYFFSKLNERSLAMASSLLKRESSAVKKPVIVFTDVYTDGENEKSSELYINAKGMGAICLNDDITVLAYKPCSKRAFYLMDDNELNNIKTLSVLADESHYNIVRKSSIWIFYQNDYYVLTEANIFEHMREQSRKLIVNKKSKKIHANTISSVRKTDRKKTQDEFEKDLKDRISKDVPSLNRVRCYQNMIFLLLRNEPLYLPLLMDDKKKTLNIAILGTGDIGMQMLLSSYWCGQLLDTTLTINMVSKDSILTVQDKINMINTDILKSTVKNSDILKVCEDSDIYNEPYFTFRFAEADIERDNIESIVCSVPDNLQDITEGVDRTFSILDADYYLIALGSDDVNIQATEMLCRSIVRKSKNRSAVVTYAVYDPDLCRSLNLNNSSMGGKIHTRAIGGLDEVYSSENIELLSIVKAIEEGSESHKYKDKLRTASENRTKEMYDFWSSTAAYIHYDYKAFCIYDRQDTDNKRWKEWLEKKRTDNVLYGEYTGNEDICDKLAWLEHRRWNAYMRSIGFQHGDEKDIPLKRHNCLVESSRDKNNKDKDLLHDACVKKNENFRKYDYERIVPK